MTSEIELLMRTLHKQISDKDRIDAAAQIAGLERMVEIQRLRIIELEANARNGSDWK